MKLTKKFGGQELRLHPLASSRENASRADRDEVAARGNALEERQRTGQAALPKNFREIIHNPIIHLRIIWNV